MESCLHRCREKNVSSLSLFQNSLLILVSFFHRTSLRCEFTNKSTSWPGVPCFYYSPGSVTLFPLQAKSEGTTDSCLPDWSLDPRVHFRGLLPLLKGTICSSAWNSSLHDFYQEFSRQFCQNQLKKQKIQLLLISNRSCSQWVNLRMCYAYVWKKKLVRMLGLNGKHDLLWLAVH